jgi:integrase
VMVEDANNLGKRLKFVSDQSERRVERVDQLAPLFAEFAERTSNTPKTKQYYRSGLRLLEGCPLWGAKIRDLRSEFIASVVFPGGVSNKNCALKTLRRMLSLAYEWKMLEKQPMIKLDTENMRSRPMSATEERMLLEGADPDMKLMLALLLDTGIRPVEGVAIRWKNIDLTNALLHVPRQAASRERSLRLTERVIELLSQRASSNKGWVFPSRSSKREHRTSASITVTFIYLRDRIGLSKEVTLFSARHSFARHFKEGHTRGELMLALGLGRLTRMARYES